ncbi:cell division protein FtsK [Kibdelosporangium persicum]|uniref:Cell division protein FtsK n=1 Tax=Kibdelosporangium persicum TaxID=2698649 RepID=A0ABX2FH44_9PSEU|nr:cell division protein FtsK [Kibdelosporangium persicum]NRN70707.1 Cell division protein FtsK [Kibdelosporangium persicum]
MTLDHESRDLVHTDVHDVVHVGPVYDAELVDGGAPTGVLRPPLRHRLASWWQRSPRVPRAFKSRAQAVQALKHAVVAVLRSPFRFLSAVARGVVVVVRAWRRWVTVRDYRTAAEEAAKLADKFTDIRALTLFRWKVTTAVTVAAVVVMLVADVLYGARALWITGLAGAVTLAIAGRRKDGSPGRKAALAGPRTLTWTMDPQVLVDAFRDAKLIGKDETLRLVERATRSGDGWAMTVDLPATRKAADVIKHREALASALAVDEVQLIVERVRGAGGHAGRVAMWVADSDPYAKDSPPTPLLRVESWDAWRPVPFGLDPRDRRIDLPLVWTSLLIGALPRHGKTMAERLAAAGLILDPHARLYVADFKGGKDWKACEQCAHRFFSGDDTDHVLMFKAWLESLVVDVQGRYARMQQLDDQICPESKITPAISRDSSVDMPVTAVIIDEAHIPLEDTTTVEVDGKKVKLGDYIGDLLTWLVRKGPAAGIVVIAATQRPDSNTIPSRLRAVLGSRFALRVMDWRDSNIILGEQMNTRGYDASTLLASHKGVGILRPDGETSQGDVLAMTLRTYYMSNHDWQTICQRGRALREAAGTLTGHAAGHDTALELDHAAVVKAIGSSTGDEADMMVGLAEPLASVVAYLGDDIDSRAFVPTAELIDALGVEPTAFGRQMAELGCGSRRERIPADDGTVRQVRGYFTADIRAAARNDGATDGAERTRHRARDNPSQRTEPVPSAVTGRKPR